MRRLKIEVTEDEARMIIVALETRSNNLHNLADDQKGKSSAAPFRSAANQYKLAAESVKRQKQAFAPGYAFTPSDMRSDSEKL
jgi:hypothetical protein